VTGFRIATFNLENFGKPSDSGVPAAERAAFLRPQLLRLRADVLCLQEVDSQRPEGGGERRFDMLDQLLAGTPYRDFERVSTHSRRGGGPRDRHNLVVLSRLPIVRDRQLLHDLVAPPSYRPLAAPEAQAPPATIEWDRPILQVEIAFPDGRRLHVVNVHLRAPRAAFIAGEKVAQAWRSLSGWAEGFFLAAVKGAGQALETRLVVEALFDADPDALIAVAGDFNADAHEAPVRIVRGDEEDAGNPHLAARTLVPVERSLADSRRFSVVHHGRLRMLDHVLVSRALLGWYQGVEIHNEALGDEAAGGSARGSPESFHAPVVAEFQPPFG